ncbi:PA14 domain-containing protein [Verrucomicrobiaceae bacterium E54]|nr:PA14 domain-containing protein [Verrucomicrobiaceae bacterium E54]
MLLGLAGVAIPVLIHLVRKQAAKPIDWGAMRFLFDTVAVRRRKMEWEDLLLMAARCLLLALVALAVARPFVPPDSNVPWMFVLPAALLGIAVLGGSFVIGNRRWRWMLRLAAVVVLLIAAGLVWFEKHLNLKRFEASGRRDVALVIDASSSMELTRGGRSVFESALNEARELVREAPRGTAFTVVLGGPAPQAVTAAPLTHRADVLGVLEQLKPVGGTFRAHEALGVATLALAEGNNASKEIVVFTDSQRHGWRLENPGAWDSLEAAWDGLPTKPKLILRNFGAPEAFRNLALTGLDFSREVVGTDRPVTVRVRVANTGTDAVTPGGIELVIDGEEVGRQAVGMLVPGQTETIVFRHPFEQPGPATVAARISVKDDLAVDDVIERVVAVRERLPVLLVDGNRAGDFFERASGYMALALAPGSARGDGDGKYLMDPEVIPAGSLREEDLEGRDVIVLADVPRLPSALATAVERRVADGAGLIVVAGPKVEPDFYNAWEGLAGPVLPMKLEGEKVSQDGVSPASATFIHESLELFREGSDLDGSRVFRWRSTGDATPGGAPGASLANGDVLLASRNYGNGRSLLVCCALDARAGDLPGKRSFVPLVHELVTWAAGGGVGLNVASSWSPQVLLGESRGGLTGRYFTRSNRQFVFERIDPAIDFDWKFEAPGKRVDRDAFEIEWSGGLVPPVTGTYAFHADADTELRLEVDDESIVWRKDEDKGLEVKLEAGKPVEFRAGFVERGGQARARVFWTPPGGTRSIVPATALRPDSGDTGPVLKAQDPRGNPRSARIETVGRGRMLTIDGAAVPGIYQVEMGEAGADWLPDWEGGTLPVAVTSSPEESGFETMRADDLEMIRAHVDLVRPESVADTLAVLQGKGFGRGIWRVLAVAAFGFFLLESVLARWVSKSRRTAEDVRLEFGENTVWEGGGR